jgi:hypothetical protein
MLIPSHVLIRVSWRSDGIQPTAGVWASTESEVDFPELTEEERASLAEDGYVTLQVGGLSMRIYPPVR